MPLLPLKSICLQFFLAFVLFVRLKETILKNRENVVKIADAIKKRAQKRRKKVGWWVLSKAHYAYLGVVGQKVVIFDSMVP